MRRREDFRTHVDPWVFEVRNAQHDANQLGTHVGKQRAPAFFFYSMRLQ